MVITFLTPSQILFVNILFKIFVSIFLNNTGLFLSVLSGCWFWYQCYLSSLIARFQKLESINNIDVVPWLLVELTQDSVIVLFFGQIYQHFSAGY
jgi:hypothetical protein